MDWIMSLPIASSKGMSAFQSWLNHWSIFQCLVDQRPDQSQFQFSIRARRMQLILTQSIEDIQSIQDIGLTMSNGSLDKSTNYDFIDSERLSSVLITSRLFSKYLNTSKKRSLWILRDPLNETTNSTNKVGAFWSC